MSLIDGIGDEVTQFLLAIILVIIVVVAWWSTNTVRDPRTTRSVYLLDYRIRTLRDQRAYLSNSLQYNRQNNRQIQLADNNRSTSTEDPIDVSGETTTNSEIINTESESNLTEVQAELERTSIIRVMDADETEVRRRRIAFFAGRTTDANSQEITSNAATASSCVPSEQTAIAQTEQRHPDEEQEHEDDEESSLSESNVFEGAYDRELDSSIMEHNYAELPIIDNRTITIKLKYTNDDMKIVTGKLQERLGDFKLRHFNDEYTSDRSVRLIFNGKILSDDDKTITSCGIFHNCVVHCLVMQGRREERQRNAGTDFSSREESVDGASRNTVFAEAARHAQFVRMQQQNAADRNGQQRQQREWNLGTLFSRCTNLLLVCAWYFRYSMPHIWTMTATMCLAALTGFSLVAHVSIFMPNGQTGEQANIQATRIDRDLNR